MPNVAPGVTVSVYFKTKKDLRRVRQAAKIRGVRLTELMREAVLAEAKRVLAKFDKASAADGR